MLSTKRRREEGIITRDPATAPVGRGTIVSIVASVLFATISLLSGDIEGLSPEVATAARVFLLVPAVFTVIALMPGGRARLVLDLRRIVRSPRLIIVVLIATTILWFQLWVFMWAPPNGRTQDVALGYFLLPLVMVLVGRVIFKDRLTGWQRAAVISAAAGVFLELLISRSLGWPALLIAGLYPVYFALRRWWRIDSLQVFFVEILLLLVPATFFAGQHFGSISAQPMPDSTRNLVILAVISAVAMILYMLASTWLPLGLFGLLSYLEPVLLIGVAVLLGEQFFATDALVYTPIATALALLAIGNLRNRRHAQGRDHPVAEPPM